MSAREAGPVITLSGEVDINTVAELNELISGQLADERLQLTVDVAGLGFADTAAIRVLLVAVRRSRRRPTETILLTRIQHLAPRQLRTITSSAGPRRLTGVR
jgi:anti-anti-sigma factor